MSRSSKRAAPPSLGRRAWKGAAYAATALARPAMRRPVASLSLAAFAAFFGVVATNALTAQAGRHTNPLLATRPGAGEAGSAEAASTPGLPVPLVAEVQAALSEAGYYAAAIDGRPGRVTAAAIRTFQTDNGLTVDGEASPRLLGALRRVAEERARADKRVASLDTQDTGTVTDATATPPAAAPPRDLVRRIQEGLSSAKVAELHADGIMGSRTEAAIRSFQASQGMDVDGIPGEAVLERLKALGAGRR